MSSTTTLITPLQLLQLQHSMAKLRILDVRWRQDRPEGLPEYLAGHIPGAVFVDLDYELANPHAPSNAGRHPLPSPAALKETVHRWGINDGDTVVVYDDLKNLSAARAWWLLKYIGLQDVRVLNGSLRGWTDAGLPVETGMNLPEPGSAKIRIGSAPMLGAADLKDPTSAMTLIDARPTGAFGSIPGAISAPAAGNIDACGRLLPPEQIRQRHLDLGVAPDARLACYCHSGIHSAHSVMALQHAGFETVLYPGGYSEWSQLTSSQHPHAPSSGLERSTHVHRHH